MNIVPFKAEHLLNLQVQLAQRGIEAFITPEYAKLAEDSLSFTAMVGDKVLICGGVQELWPGRATAWTLISRDAGPYFVGITKAVRRLLDSVPYRRIEADAACGFPQGHRWLKMLGFRLEAERMVAYLPDGTDCALYARVK